MPRLRRQPSRVPIPQAAGACTAFAAFSVSVVVGIASNNPADTVLLRAIVALIAGFGGGFLVGLVCDWIVGQQVAAIEAASAGADSADRAARAAADELGDVEIVEEDDSMMAANAVQSENREAVGARREKNAA